MNNVRLEYLNSYNCIQIVCLREKYLKPYTCL